MRKFLILVMIFTMFISVDAFAAIDVNAVNNKMLASINDLRKSNGEKALTLDKELISIAKIRAEEASSKWSHTRPNGQQGSEMISPDKWRGENLSRIKGTEDINKATKMMFDDLVASPAHYDNMVFSDFTKIGIYSYVKDGRITVAYMFSN